MIGEGRRLGSLRLLSFDAGVLRTSDEQSFPTKEIVADTLPSGASEAAIIKNAMSHRLPLVLSCPGRLIT